MPLESVLMASQAAQAAELEWDAAGCTLDAESCNEMQIEELMVTTNQGGCFYFVLIYIITLNLHKNYMAL